MENTTTHYTIASNSDRWAAIISLISIRAIHGSPRMKVYKVRVQLTTSTGKIDDQTMEHDSAFKFDPEDFRVLCALRASNLEDKTPAQLTARMFN
jgi:hypothetical protein